MQKLLLAYVTGFHRIRLPAVAVLLVTVAGCAAQGVVAVSDRLYFGRSIPGGVTVSDSAWSDFLASVVTPRFPSGFTVWPSTGQWRDARGEIGRENSFIFELYDPAGSPPDSTLEIIAE